MANSLQPQQAAIRRVDPSSLPWPVAEFLKDDVGAAHGLGLPQKKELLQRFTDNNRQIQSASHWLEHLAIATAILRLPPERPGIVVECGCFKGGSTANLSLACGLVGRKLLVCDSFAGLPEPQSGEEVPALEFPAQRKKPAYTAGQYAGSLDEVRANVAAYGCLDACEFLPGFFEQTLGGIDQPVATAFLDVDLRSSLETCLLALWPRLHDQGQLFSHEAQDLNFVALFFNDAWWQEHFGCVAPGFVGAGTGLPLGSVGPGSSLGYTVKRECVDRSRVGSRSRGGTSSPRVLENAKAVDAAASATRTRPFYFDREMLSGLGAEARAAFCGASPFPHIVIDDLLPPSVLEEVLAEFPDPAKVKWKQCYHENSKKLSCADEYLMGDKTRHLIGQLNSGAFLRFLEQMTGIEGLIPDPHLFGGGLHLIEPGGFLKIHADFNVHQQLKLDRRLNLLLFLNQDWQESYGGHLELWDRGMTTCQRRVLPVFNRCVVFATTDWSYHGHPEPLTCPPNRSRKSIAMYYYTNGRPQEEISKPHSTLYQRPRA